MKSALFITVIAMWPAWVCAQAADVQAQAQSALRNGVPQTAIAPLKEALRKGQGDRTALSLLLARLQLAAGSPEDALKTLDNGRSAGNDEWKVLRGAALAAQGGNAAAANLLAPIAPNNDEAALLLARIRAEQGDNQAAAAVLSKIASKSSANAQILRLRLDVKLSAGDTAGAAELLQTVEAQGLLPPAETSVAKGRLLLAEGKPAEAAEVFQSALSSPDISPQVRDNARLGLARSASVLGDTTRARTVLREGLAAGTTSAALRKTMEEWIALEKASGADPSGDLRSWSAEKKGMRATEAALQLAQLDLETRATEAAAKSMQELLAREDLDPEQKHRAELLVVEANIAAGQSAEALTMLDSMAAEDDYGKLMLRGRALAASGANRQAHTVFGEAAKTGGTPGAILAAAANRFITALATGDLALAREAWQALQKTAANDPRLLEWSFLMASAEARQGTTDSLAALARRTPATDYSFKAKLALAEWRLARGEAVAAERILKTAEPEADAPTRAASLAAAGIFAADNAGAKSRGELVAECENFLSQHADAPESADVSFKLAELQARGGDHAAAETTLAQLAEKTKDTESAALAKFLAAQAASRSMSPVATERALVWLNELAQGQSSLKHRARFEQASLLLRQKKFADALALHESTLAANPPDEVKHAAQMERADVLFAMGAAQPEKFDEASVAYELIAADQSATPDWRDQAVCKRAAALARRGQTDKALALYREVLERPAPQGADQFWLIKAGIEAGRLLEEQQDWEAAVAVYDQLASAGGTQREELMQRARRLRLEHFIWEN